MVGASSQFPRMAGVRLAEPEGEPYHLTLSLGTYELKSVRQAFGLEFAIQTKLTITDVNFEIVRSAWSQNKHCGTPGYGLCGRSEVRTQQPDRMHFGGVVSISLGTGSGNFANKPAIIVRAADGDRRLEIAGESPELQTAFHQLVAAYEAWQQKHSGAQRR